MDHKPGHLTSEFYLHLGAVVIGALVSCGILSAPGVPPVVAQLAGAGMAILGALGYGAQRTYLKAMDLSQPSVVEAAASLVVPLPQPPAIVPAQQ